MEFKLTKPLQHGTETIDVLTLREPTAREIKKYGLPVNVAESSVDTNVVFQYVVELAALPPSVVDQMSARDFTEAIKVVAGFFGE